MASDMTSGSFLGNAVRRLEDPDLLTGASNYVGDLTPNGTVHLAFVRSVMAHAELLSIDTTAARQAPGVVGVFTSDNLDIAPQHTFVLLPPTLTKPMLTDKARYVGDHIAVVAAETKAAAVDAAELVEVEYEPLEAVTDPFEALKPETVLINTEHGSNLAIRFDNSADPELLNSHDLAVSGRFVNQRMAGAPIEPLAVLAVPGEDGLTLWCSTQRPHEARNDVAAALGEPTDRVRLIAPAVGGGFGPKAATYPEYVIAAWLARHLERPVKWVETRSENLLNMVQGRDQTHDVELGLKRDGTFCWLKVSATANVGAYPGIGAFLPFFTMMMASGPYRIPTVGYEAVSVLTNATPIAALRGAGRPEATVSLERIIDLAAVELGMDPAELRRRNLLAPEDFPYTTPTGANMDCGNYARALDLALQESGYEELRAAQQSRRASGDKRLLGIGVSVYVEVTAAGLVEEFGSVAVGADGTITVRVGTASHGQGHVTAFTQLLCEVFGVGPEQVRIIHSDTQEVPRGSGTVASRSLQIAGSAVWNAAHEVLDKARHLAASLLEADIDDIVSVSGGLAVAGVPARTLSWAELAAAAMVSRASGAFTDEAGGAVKTPEAANTGEAGEPPEGAATGGLSAETDFNQGESSFPFGAHVSVVEIDSETGDTRVLRHVAVDDCGRILNPLLVTGQVHGGTAFGISQALYEHITYDDDGNPRNTNFADYAIPAASELPRLVTAHTQTPTPLNPLGAKGIGESGTIGSTPAVQSAVLDALSPLGITHLDMPFTPWRVWSAISATNPKSDSSLKAPDTQNL